MSDKDKMFLAYLVSWAVDRIVTAIYHNNENPLFSMGLKLCSYKELREQADILIREFNAKPTRKAKD